MIECWSAEVWHGNELKSTGLFLLTVEDASTKLVKLLKTLTRLAPEAVSGVTPRARIYHNETLVYECDEKGKRTGGSWEVLTDGSKP